MQLQLAPQNVLPLHTLPVQSETSARVGPGARQRAAAVERGGVFYCAAAPTGAYTSAITSFSIGATITSHSRVNCVVPSWNAVVPGNADLSHPGGRGFDAEWVVPAVQEGSYL